MRFKWVSTLPTSAGDPSGLWASEPNDEGNYIVDLHLHRIAKPRQVALVMNQIPGVVENGLFIDICDSVVIGYGDGKVETRDINEGTVETDRLDFVESDNLFADLND